MAPGKLLRRGAAKTPRCEPYPSSTGKIPSRPKRLSRELEGLAPWSGWKRNSTQRTRRESSDSTETEEGTTGSSSSAEASGSTDRTTQASLAEERGAKRRLKVRLRGGDTELRRNTVEEVRSIQVGFLDEDSDDGDTILVAAPNVNDKNTSNVREPAELSILTSTHHGPGSAANTDTLPTLALLDTQTEEDRAALSGPRCPLCICPINSVYFPVIKCTACNRTYHTSCIGSRRPPQYHPFGTSSDTNVKRCFGCGCPDGETLAIYCGCPSVLFHRRDQDPGFREYFRCARMEKAKYDDLV